MYLSWHSLAGSMRMQTAGACVLNDVLNGVLNDILNDVLNGVLNDILNHVLNGAPNSVLNGGLNGAVVCGCVRAHAPCPPRVCVHA